MRKRILDEPIDILSLDEAVYRVKTALLHSKQLKIITLNPEMIVNATKSLEFQAAINNSDLIVADGTGIERGALLQLTDPRTASAVTAIRQNLAGIAAVEKVASDGSTRLAVYRSGIFDMVASGALIGVGNPVMAAGDTAAVNANKVILAAGAALSGATVLGYALETAADGEVFQVLVDIGTGATV